MENPTHTLYKNCELKVKLWWVGGHERKKCFFCDVFFLFFFLSQGIFSAFVFYLNV